MRSFFVFLSFGGKSNPAKEDMARRKIVQHRILDLSATLFVIVLIATLRSAFFPVGDEAIANIATPVGSLLQSLQQRIPTLSIFVWGVLLMFAGLDAGRYGPKFSLYPAYTLMAIPVFGIVAGAVMVSGEYLLSAAAMMLMLLGTKYLLRCIMRTDSYNDLSLAMLCYGTLPLLFAPAALLYAALPILVLVVRSTWRDWVVSVTSLLFPLLSVSYWSWCAGNGFLSTGKQLYTSMLTPSEFGFFSTLNIAGIALLGIIIVMVLCAVSLIISDRHSLKVKSRAVMKYNAFMLLVTLAMFFMPSCTATLFAIVATPVAILTPLIFVRMGIGFTESLYRFLLLAAAANMVVMCL